MPSKELNHDDYDVLELSGLRHSNKAILSKALPCRGLFIFFDVRDSVNLPLDIPQAKIAIMMMICCCALPEAGSKP